MSTFIYPILLLSGAVLMCLEVLWMRGLTLAVGVAPRASALTLAAVLLGWAAGALVLPRRAGAIKSPGRFAAWLHVAAAATGLGFYLLEPAMLAIHARSVAVGVDGGGVSTVAEMAVALLFLFPPAFFLGGILPVLLPLFKPAQVARAYAIYTLGSVVGAWLSGFFLLRFLGFNLSYVFVLVACLVVGALCARLGAGFAGAAPHSTSNTEPPKVLPWLAFLSGGMILAMEVLWSRMLSLVSDNSVYAFSLVVLLFLVGLTIGAFIAGRLRARELNMLLVVGVSLSAGGLLLVLVPISFAVITDQLTPIPLDGSWSKYLFRLTLVAAAVTLPPAIVLGLVFPSLLSGCAEGGLGRLFAINTAGAVLGSLAAGFFLLDTLGLWQSIYLLGGIALVVGAWVAHGSPSRIRTERWLPVVGGVLLLILWQREPLPLQAAVTLEPGEERLETVESGEAVITVVRSRDDIQLRVNNAYTVGSARGRYTALWLGHQPLLLHPRAKSVLFLGMGTGISASAALEHPLQQITVCELLPDLFRLSDTYFSDYVGGLHSDPRVQRFVGDARILLTTDLPKQDVIVADLFVPWKSGAGQLYTYEHDVRVRDALADEGLFVQWLPLFQMTEAEFGSVVRTLLEVFPQVTLWRGTFDLSQPIVGVVGHQGEAPLRLENTLSRLKTLPPALEGTGTYVRFWKGVEGMLRMGDERRGADPFLLYYAGNPGMAAELFQAFPRNGQDRPFIEYEAPMRKHQEPALTGSALVTWFERLQEACPPDADPFLRDVTPAQRQFVEVGLRMSRQAVGRR